MYSSVNLPSQMGELGVDRASYHLCVDLFELGHVVAEGDDLRRADKGAGRGEERWSTS